MYEDADSEQSENLNLSQDDVDYDYDETGAWDAAQQEDLESLILAVEQQEILQTTVTSSDFNLDQTAIEEKRAKGAVLDILRAFERMTPEAMEKQARAIQKEINELHPQKLGDTDSIRAHREDFILEESSPD